MDFLSLKTSACAGSWTGGLFHLNVSTSNGNNIGRRKGKAELMKKEEKNIQLEGGREREGGGGGGTSDGSADCLRETHLPANHNYGR